jgi:hypothetical protein
VIPPDRPDVSEQLRDLVDDYCSDLLDESGFAELEAILVSSEPARHYFAEFWQIHAELAFSTRAKRAASVALSRFEQKRARSSRPRIPRRWLALAGSLLAAAGFAVGQWSWKSRRGVEAAPKNVAWLINAQDCLWAADDADTPGRDMKVGKVLRLDRGLAEVEFDRGARVILKGPAALELLSDNAARLLSGELTAKVPVPAHGFTVYSPQGKVVDLGTEFGVSVDDPGTTSVRVFAGELTAQAKDDGRSPVLLVKGQEALIDGRAVALRPADTAASSKFTRVIEPPPLILPRRLTLDFSKAVDRTLLDLEGRGVGLTSRLAGTGSSLKAHDPNLRLDVDSHALELTTTRSDLNKQVGMDVGEYLGFKLSELGFTGSEDFTISVEIPDIPGLEVVGQFGLYAGAASGRTIRGGVLSQPSPGRYSLFLVNTEDGIDKDIHEVGLTNVGDHLRFTLQRDHGRYSLLVENLTRQSSSRLAIAHPNFLDGERDLFVGIFGANTQSDVRKTLKIKELGVTVMTRSPSRATEPAAGSAP